MKTCPGDFKPLLFLNSKSRPLCQENQSPQSPSSPKNQQIEGYIDQKKNKKFGDFHQDSIPKQSVASESTFCSTPALPSIKPKPLSSTDLHHKRLEEDAPLSFSALPEDIGKTYNVSNTNDTSSLLNVSPSPSDPEPPQSPDPFSLGSRASRCSSSTLFSHSPDLSTFRSSVMSVRNSAESQCKGPEGVISSSPVPSLRVLPTPVSPHHPPLPLLSPSSLITNSLSSLKRNGQTKARSLPQISPVTEPKLDESDVELKWSCMERQIDLAPKTAPGLNVAMSVSARSRPPSPLRPLADTPLELTPSPPASFLGSSWPVLPPIRMQQDGSMTARSSEQSCGESQVFDELDALAPLSASFSSMDQPSESSHCHFRKAEALSSGLALLTVGCDSGPLSSLSRVQLLLLNRQETDAASPFCLDEDSMSLNNYPDLEMSNGVWRPFTAGSISESISEKCVSMGKTHQNKLDDDMECFSGSSCSWIIDPSSTYRSMSKSSTTQRRSSLDSLEDEMSPFGKSSNYSGFARESEETCPSIEINEDQERKWKERNSKALKMLSKLQDNAPHQLSNVKVHSNFEDFDFLAKYCIFNQERLAEYKSAFQEADSDGDGFLSCLQVLCVLKRIIPPELLSEEEEIYVYRILELVDFRVTDGLVDLRLFAVIASLAQRISRMDDYMRSLISSTDFHSLEVKLFKAKKLFLCLLEEQSGDVTSPQKYISPEQLILELKAGGLCLEHEATIRMELQHIPPLDLLDFLAYLPLFMLIHRSVIDNPLEDYNYDTTS
ncbi:unnamed protein product [Knipowitschia caucasica]